MTKYLNKVGPGYVPPPLANDQIRLSPEDDTQPGLMIMGCTDPEADNYLPEANSDDGSCTYAILGDDDTTDDSTPSLGEKTAGFMGLPKIAWIAIIGVGVYYAYSKGMLKKLLK
jgi:hypothetical protein